MEHWGYDFDMASNGEEAVEYALKNEGKYDLGLMDIEMPLMDGMEATQRIRQETKYFPIIAYSSNSAHRKQCFECGCDAFVEKPILPSDLNKALDVVQKSAFENSHIKTKSTIFSYVNIQKMAPGST